MSYEQYIPAMNTQDATQLWYREGLANFSRQKVRLKAKKKEKGQIKSKMKNKRWGLSQPCCTSLR